MTRLSWRCEITCTLLCKFLFSRKGCRARPRALHTFWLSSWSRSVTLGYSRTQRTRGSYAGTPSFNYWAGQGGNFNQRTHASCERIHICAYLVQSIFFSTTADNAIFAQMRHKQRIRFFSTVVSPHNTSPVLRPWLNQRHEHTCEHSNCSVKIHSCITLSRSISVAAYR